MTETFNPGYGSPFVQGTRATSPKAVMIRLWQESANKSKDKLIQLFREEAKNDPELTDICIEIAAINAYFAVENLLRQPDTPTVAKAEKAAAKEERKAKAAEVVEQIKRACILDFVMPNEKSMRDCTFREVAQCGRQFARIAKAGRPTQVVGKVLSDQQANALMWGKAK